MQFEDRTVDELRMMQGREARSSTISAAAGHALATDQAAPPVQVKSFPQK